MTEQEKQELLSDMRKLRERLLTDPQEDASLARSISHWAGLVSEAVLEVEAMIEKLSK